MAIDAETHSKKKNRQRLGTRGRIEGAGRTKDTTRRTTE
jgi:hypothetical protein